MVEPEEPLGLTNWPMGPEGAVLSGVPPALWPVDLRESVGPTRPTVLIAGQIKPAALMARLEAVLVAGPVRPTVWMDWPAR